MKIGFLILLSLLSLITRAQTDKDVFKIYEQQYAELLQLRGVGGDDISLLMEKYAENKVDSDSSVAALLEKLYSSERNIALLFYFFNNDTLRRAYYEPGAVINVSYIPIKKDQLITLGQNIATSLNLYQLSSSRSATQRGSMPLTRNTDKTLSFDAAIKLATEILLPASFDKATRHLLVIPALNIGTIPFHLLKPYGNEEYLSDRCSFTIVPSMIDLIALRSKLLKKNAVEWNGAQLEYDFDTNPYFAGIDKSSFTFENPLIVCNPLYPKDSAFHFPNLPGAVKEINAILPFIKKDYKLFKGSTALKDSVLKYIFDADVAYFATHGIADQKDPMGKSFLVLSEPAPYLTAKEIMTMRRTDRNLPALIILSACQTGLGKSMEAGTAGLARSFLLGGSNHVIMSLWNVDDDATAYFMSRFVYHLQTKKRFMPAEQLRLAMLDTKKIYKNPSKWGSFSLFGIDY